MAELTHANGRPVLDYMARDAESFLASMRALIPEKLPEWTDYQSEADVGNVLLELFAHLGDILSYYQDRVANESFLATAQSRRSVIEHLRLIGYELGTASPASTLLTVSVDAAVTGTVQVHRGDAFATRSRRGAPSVRFEYTGPTKPLTDFPDINVPDVNGRKAPAKGIRVEEGRLVVNEVLGTSDGSPGQRFALVHPRV